MSVTLRNVSGEPIHVGSSEGRRLESNEYYELDGEVLDGPDDAYVIGQPAPPVDDDDPESVAAHDEIAREWRVYPKSIWELVTAPSSSGGENK